MYGASVLGEHAASSLSWLTLLHLFPFETFMKFYSYQTTHCYNLEDGRVCTVPSCQTTRHHIPEDNSLASTAARTSTWTSTSQPFAQVQQVQQDRLKLCAVVGCTHVSVNGMCFRVEFLGSDSWGSQDDEGAWVGLLGMLAEGAVDLMVCHPTLTTDRTAVALFLHPTLHTRYIL
jgi:hypothetical protein